MRRRRIPLGPMPWWGSSWRLQWTNRQEWAVQLKCEINLPSKASVLRVDSPNSFFSSSDALPKFVDLLESRETGEASSHFLHIHKHTHDATWQIIRCIQINSMHYRQNLSIWCLGRLASSPLADPLRTLVAGIILNWVDCSRCWSLVWSASCHLWGGDSLRRWAGTAKRSAAPHMGVWHSLRWQTTQRIWLRHLQRRSGYLWAPAPHPSSSTLTGLLNFQLSLMAACMQAVLPKLKFSMKRFAIRWKTWKNLDKKRSNCNTFVLILINKY